MEPEASVSAIARRIGIHPSQWFGWRRDARARQGRLRSLCLSRRILDRFARGR
ncbi:MULTISPECIES: transposase [Agrobacterium]|nr:MULTISPECIES: transposase [Agrobacterium]